MGRRKGKESASSLAVPPNSRGLMREAEISDMESVTAYSASVLGGASTGVGEDYANELNTLVDTFVEQVEDAQDKKASTRVRAMTNISRLLRHFSLTTENVVKWKLTLCEVMEKNLRRSPEEALLACSLASLLCIQLGSELHDAMAGSLAAMRTTLVDPTASEAVRASCAQAVAVCLSLNGDGQHSDACAESLRLLRSVWYEMDVSGASAELFSSALLAWLLLLGGGGPSARDVSTTIGECQSRLCAFLHSPSVEVRISAGEALAVLHEMGVNRVDEEFEFEDIDQLEDLLNGLALDSKKNRAKRDRKAQKLSFRQINDAIFNNNMPQTKIRFNTRETLELEGCYSQLKYEAICQLLKNETNKHLSLNQVLRDYFGIEESIQADTERETKQAKAERMSRLAAESKNRNIRRGRQRDNKAL